MLMPMLAPTPTPVVKQIPIWTIVLGKRKHLPNSKSIDFLKTSIKQIGVRQPIIVRKEFGHYTLIDGMIRTCAAKELSHSTILARII